MNTPARLLFAMLTVSIAWSQTSFQNPAIVDGEELRYKVKWQFIRLGTIIVRTFRDTSCTSQNLYKVTMDVESNPSISLVSIRDHNESLVDVNRMASLRFYADQDNGRDRFQLVHVYDSASRTASWTRTDLRSGNILASGTLDNIKPYVEGPALFLMTRCMARAKEYLRVPTLVNGKMGTTTLDFRGPVEEVEVMGRTFSAREYYGEADWEGGGSAGMSGSFSGWISNDEYSVILKAEMDITVGSIRLELEEWRKPMAHDSSQITRLK